MTPARGRRVAAVAALAAVALAAVLLLLLPFTDFPGGLIAVGLLVLALAATWHALTHRGLRRLVAVTAAALALGSLAVLLIYAKTILDLLLAVGCLAAAGAAARLALAAEPGTAGPSAAPGRRVAPSQRGLLLMNPRSGGGKVERFRVAREAARRGIEPMVLEPGDDLQALARQAVGRGADVIGMAGGDGSQAVVAGVAREHDVAYVCVPAGTRNHLAIDLGVDRDAVIGSLDAFTDGLERRVDLATVNDLVFVNNVSLGVYAQIVACAEYRDAKVRTALDRLPDLIGPGAEPFGFHYAGPGGAEDDRAHLILVSNNPYALDRLAGLGSRPRMDGGELGVVTIRITGPVRAAQFAALERAGLSDRFLGWREWTAPSFEVAADGPIAAGVDGESLSLDAPLCFAIEPGVLRVRIARDAPGSSPAARPALSRSSIGALASVAAGRADAAEPGHHADS